MMKISTARNQRENAWFLFSHFCSSDRLLQCWGKLHRLEMGHGGKAFPGFLDREMGLDRSSYRHTPKGLCFLKKKHTCNPSDSGGRYQEDHGSKSAWVNSSCDPISKNPSQKKGWRSGLRHRS
jgi:hypothetical protein